MTPTNEYFDNLRADEEQQHRERKIDETYADSADTARDGQADGPEPGHLGNDLSKMTLLETDLEQIAKQQDPEPNPEIQEALQKLQDVPLVDEKGNSVVNEDERTLADVGVKDEDNAPDRERYQADAEDALARGENVKADPRDDHPKGAVARPDMVTDADTAEPGETRA